LESLANGASQVVLLEVQQQTMGYLLDERLNKLEEVAQVWCLFVSVLVPSTKVVCVCVCAYNACLGARDLCTCT